MAGNFQYRQDRSFSPLVATAAVLLLGAIGAGVIVASTGTDAIHGIVIYFCIVAFIPVLGVLFRAQPVRTLSSVYGWMRKSPKKVRKEYALRTSQPVRVFGGNQPPTAEALKEMKEGSIRNWVPDQASAKKHRGLGQ
ncbi:hypothetical protein SH668x_003287 [Planctomicrobium sp. SH668]|uniref:hypothetical protein n=1 Tax=Planctomicrobium sp. SH668 TaxID=3448126 RepID=UPI003F5BB9FC